MRVVRGAFDDPGVLDALGAKPIEVLERSEWQSIDEVTVDREQIRDLQKHMTRHFDDSEVPWYMDGYSVQDANKILVAFGADDGEGGRSFEFMRDDAEAVSEVIAYGAQKGIPKEQLDFLDIDF